MIQKTFFSFLIGTSMSSRYNISTWVLPSIRQAFTFPTNKLIKFLYYVTVTLLATVTDLPGLSGNDLDDLSLAPPSPPHFKTENSSMILAQTGSTAFIPCVVTNLGEGTVSGTFMFYTYLSKNTLRLQYIGIHTGCFF